MRCACSKGRMPDGEFLGGTRVGCTWEIVDPQCDLHGEVAKAKRAWANILLAMSLVAQMPWWRRLLLRLS